MMMKRFEMRATLSLLLTQPLLLALAACGGSADAPAANAGDAGPADEAEHVEGEEEGVISLSPQQIAAAGITIVQPTVGGGGLLTLPATIEGDPEGTQVVSAAIGGRVVSLTRNLGEAIGRGQVLAVIESREAASLNAEVEAARARLALARSNLGREQRLYAERVSPEQDLIAARTAATEAGIALRLAQQQVSAAGGGGGSLNRIGIVAPIGGQVIARSVVLGQTVTADAELFRVANLAQVSLTLSLSPADAGQVSPGVPVEVSASGRRAVARVKFVSPVLDPATRQVTVIAMVDNRDGAWRVGEPVTAAVRLASGNSVAVSVPTIAVQTVEGRPTVFVRTPTGFRAVHVTIDRRSGGKSNGGTVVVTEGLSGREAIAAANSFTLKAELGKGEAEHGH